MFGIQIDATTIVYIIMILVLIWLVVEIVKTTFFE